MLGACSFIYNPDHINKDIDAQVVDAEMVVDVNPAGLKLTDVYPKTVYEGVGTGGSRKALIVIRGEEIAETATLTIKPASGADTQIMVDPPMISKNHLFIATTITVPVDPMQDETGTNMKAALPLQITVDNGMGFTASLNDTLTVTWLDQLTTPLAAPLAPTAKKLYSQIDVTAAQPFSASAASHRVELHAVSSINFHAGVTANANADTPGVGGCAGGATGLAGAQNAVDGATCSSGHTGASGTATGGGGGGYVLAGNNAGAVSGGDPTGEVQIRSLATNVAGGGGGGNAVLLAAPALLGGGAGGGGGGTIWLEAGGNLTVTSPGGTTPAIAADGAAGTGGGLGGGGGGGAGGTVILRSGGTLSLTGAISVAGKGGGAGANAGGAAHDGRVRYDAAMPMGITSGYAGAMFLTIPAMSNIQQIVDHSIVLVGAAGETGYTGFVYGPDDSTTNGQAFSVSFGGDGKAKPDITLTAGYNKVCVYFIGGNVLQNSLQGTCAEIAFIP